MSLLKERTVFLFIAAALVFGAAYRLFPVIAGPPALAQFFMTEDGYLMLTIARNMAIGLGMSVSDGTIPSNGVQPLATFLFALPYLLTGGDKTGGLVGVHLISVVISVAAVFSVRALARDVLRPQDPSPLWPWLVAALWFVSPLLLLHTMNGLETGLYTLMVTVTLLLFGRLLARGEAATMRDRLILGGACGVTFLARNDAVFLITAIFAVWAVHDLVTLRRSLADVVLRLIPPGLLSVALAAPWLINNYLNFGSIVPISGAAEARGTSFAAHADLLPAKLFELFFPMLPVPGALERNPVFMAVALLLVAVIVLSFLVGVWRRGGVMRYVIGAYVLFALAICFYYGFTFGAPWFLSRYLSPLAPLAIIASISVLIGLAQRLAPGNGAALVRLLGVAGLALSVALLARFLVPGAREQGHFQVVEWVQQNVADEAWVGAIQTGTLGYWHDRTINLDGKVNPDALRALQEEGNVLDYVLNSPIEYLADWHGIATWTTTGNMGNTAFSDSFEVVVEDPARNLGVLKRK